MRTEVWIALNWLVKLFKSDARDIWLATLYGIISSLLFLALPISVQALVNSVGFGSVYQPILVMTLIVFIILLFSGASRALQVYGVEIIQQRLLVRITLEMAERLAQVPQNILEKQGTQSIVQRFSDIILIQRTSSVLILEGSIMFIQILFGAILLGFYHPYLMMFDLILMLAIVLSLLLPFFSGAYTSIQESKAKYEIGSWLAQTELSPISFRSAGNDSHVLNALDRHISEYIYRRKAHFRVLYRQVLSFLVIQVLAMTLLLGLGGWLVVAETISMGQLVASEIVVGMMVINIGKLHKQIEALYDLIASCFKVGSFFNLPTEPPSGSEKLDIKLKNITLEGSSYGEAIFESPNLYSILDKSGEKSKALFKLLFAIDPSPASDFLINGVSIRDLDMREFRNRISFVSPIEPLFGNILENLQFGNSYSIEEITKVATAFGFGNKLSEDISTNEVLINRLRLAKVCLQSTDLVLIDHIFDSFSEDELEKIMPSYRNLTEGRITICSTAHVFVAEKFDRRMST